MSTSMDEALRVSRAILQRLRRTCSGENVAYDVLHVAEVISAEGANSMSDSMRDSGQPVIHPIVAAFREFKARKPDTFTGTTYGQYLENRLNVAFLQGWEACEARIKAALEGRDV